MMTNDRDRLIRLAISAPQDLQAPSDLGDAILRAVAATPQRRGALGWLRSSFTDGRLSPAIAGLGLLALLLVAALIVALAQPPARSHRLSMYHGGSDRTGVMTGPGVPADPVVVWDVTRPGPMPYTTMPLVADGRVFVADSSGSVAALDAASGAPIWQTRIGAGSRGTPALVGDLIVAGTDNGDVVALHTADGSQAWDTRLGAAAIAASLLVDGDRIYAAGEDSALHVLDARTGQELWSTGVGGPVSHGPALAGGVLFIGATGGRFSAIDVGSETDRWTVELGPGGIGTPALGGGLAYVGRGLLATTGSHDLVALDAATGQQRWSFAAPDGSQVHAGALAGGVVYAVTDGGSVFALDAASGAVRWTATPGGTLGTLASIVDGVVYVGSSDRTVRAFDAASGRELWRIAVAGLPTQQAVVDGRLFVGTNLGHVVAIGADAAASGAASDVRRGQSATLR